MARDDNLLMRFHDGELDEEQARALEQRLRDAPATAGRLKAMATLGDALRERTRLAAQSQSFDGFFERVERGAREARPMSRRERFVFRLRERVTFGLRDILRPWVVWPAAAAGLALLALVAVGMGTGNEDANNCTIESLEYSSGAGAVFLIPSEKGTGHTTVIWTNEAEEQDDAESY
jgi:anti-sigma factor RsiW